MATLHIEHPITRLETWLHAFSQFSDARANAGVMSEKIRVTVSTRVAPDEERSSTTGMLFRTERSFIGWASRLVVEMKTSKS